MEINMNEQDVQKYLLCHVLIDGMPTIDEIKRIKIKYADSVISGVWLEHENYYFKDGIYHVYQNRLDISHLGIYIALRKKCPNDLFLQSLFQQQVNLVESAIRSYRRYREAITEQSMLINNIFAPQRIMDIDKFLKAAKKYKPHFVRGELILEFRKVKFGNETEGYIKARKVLVGMDSNFEILSLEFHYPNGLKLKTSSVDGLHIPIHPHIDVPNICYGNRDIDATGYIKHQEYDFFLILLKETLNNYNHESPYYSLTTIRSYIAAGLKVFKRMPKDASAYEITQALRQT